MKLRKKLILSLFGLFCVLSVAIIVVLNLVVLPEVARLESVFHQKDMERIHMALQYEQKRLERLVVDWAQWDDTYAFAQTHDPDYIQSNLPDDQLSFLDISFLMMRDTQNNVLLKVNNATFPAEVAAALEQSLDSRVLEQISDEAGEKSGLFLMGQHAYFVSASPILTSEGLGVSRGFLYMGKVIDMNYQAVLSNRVRLPVEFVIAPKHTNNHAVYTQFEIDNSLSFTDPNEQHELHIHWALQNVFYDEVVDTIGYIVSTILTVGAITMATAYVAFRHNVMMPLTLLIQQTEAFGKSKAIYEFRSLRRNDEFGELSASFKRMAKKLNENWRLLERERSVFLHASLTDVLTSLHNRRYLEQRLKDETSWLGENQCAFFMFDIDHFKSVNDQYGHDVGDLVLKQFACVLREECRDDDILVRYGGEEFTLVANGMQFADAKGLAERIRQRIEAQVFGNMSVEIHISCSIGFFCVADLDDGHLYHYWQDMLKVADIALYLCKCNGRNVWIGLEAVDVNSLQPCPVSSQDIRNHVQQGAMRLTKPHAEEHVDWC